MSTEATVIRQCPNCGKTLKIPSKYLGLKVACNNCDAHFVVKPATAGGGTQLADVEEAIVDEELEELKKAKEASSHEVSQITPPSTPAAERQEASGPVAATAHGYEYSVARVHLGGRMVQATIEESLNKYAADGWRFRQAIHHGTEIYVVFERPTNPSGDSGGE